MRALLQPPPLPPLASCALLIENRSDDFRQQRTVRFIDRFIYQGWAAGGKSRATKTTSQFHRECKNCIRLCSTSIAAAQQSLHVLHPSPDRNQTKPSTSSCFFTAVHESQSIPSHYTNDSSPASQSLARCAAAHARIAVAAAAATATPPQLPTPPASSSDQLSLDKHHILTSKQQRNKTGMSKE